MTGGRPAQWWPLAESDPAPGDPDEVAALARRFALTAEAVATAEERLRQVRDGTAWRSEAGRAFATRAGETAEAVTRVERRYAAGAAVLTRYAAELADVQEESLVLLRQAESARDDVVQAEAAQEPWTRSGQWLPLPSRDLVAARARLAALRDRASELTGRWRQHGERAAAALDAAREEDGLDDGRWDDLTGFFGDAGDALSTAAAAVGAVAALVAVVAIALPALAVVAATLAGAAFLLSAAALLSHALSLGTDGVTSRDVALDAVGVASFGLGRVAALVATRLTAQGARTTGVVTGGWRTVTGAAVPRSGEWARAFTDPLRDVAMPTATGVAGGRSARGAVAVLRSVRGANAAAAGVNDVGSTVMSVRAWGAPAADPYRRHDRRGGRPSARVP